ncbi:hypothetical protein [Deinococcus cellulosilyticus]|uniref:Uncharacterized protein n=1 Tax=Deinococcus cellulosilyticus (strain DSM 18568 / NBRC 106333 / KACC 11606 / 5516J-15) TaxID=1223518 RepID=A0A511NB61_DEIC1|nr:hypothetical protein [Deinococcus cellulosilyticus]GEM49827.1 hypothetical protein DC3_54620 [Deinococcus cellulosilyticus NBRC 106333 = KACC 11606]
MSRVLWVMLLWVVCGVAAAQQQEIQQTKDWLAWQSSQFTTYMSSFVGDPFAEFYGVTSKVGKGVYEQWITVGIAIACAGLAAGMWKAYKTGNSHHVKDVLVTWAVACGLISWMGSDAKYSLRYMITEGVTSSYAFGVNNFGTNVDVKMKQAEDAFLDMIATGTLVATTIMLPEAKGAMVATEKQLAGKVASGELGKLGAGIQKVGKGVEAGAKSGVEFLFQSLGGTFTALNYFITGYMALIQGAGWSTLVVLIGLPVAFGLLPWGETRVIWTMLATWMGCMLAMMLMPLVLVFAIDTAFVQPVKAMKTYTANLGWYAQKQQEISNKGVNELNTKVKEALDICEAERKKDPNNIDTDNCQKVTNGGILSFLSSAGDWFKTIGQEIHLLMASLADQFVGFGLLIMRLAIGIVLAGLIMFGVPALTIAMFGGHSLKR